MDAGELLPGMLVPDVPTQNSGLQPQRISAKLQCAIEADKALAKSLNIPAVSIMLQILGLEKI